MFISAQTAWFGQLVQEVEGTGDNLKPRFRTFDELYDHEEHLLHVFDPNVVVKRSRRLSEKERKLEFNRRRREFKEKLQRGEINV